MGNSDILDILANLPFFEGMDEATCRVVADCASETACEHGHHLFFEGDPADQFYFVLEGQVALQMSAGSLGFFTIEELKRGDMLGWSWLFEPYRWTLTGRAKGQVRLLSFDARCLRGKCASDPALHFALMERVAQVSAQRLSAARVALINQIV